MIRHRYLALVGSLAFVLSACVGRPAFVPTGRQLYDRFTPLAEPRPEVPVGALWIDRYGASGEGAAADNLVTTRSLSGVMFDADFQADLTLGVLKILDLDPSFRKKMVVRLADLSIIRVKDWSKLAGPIGEPRIYEALKAGTISITTTSAGGLDIENRIASQNMPVIGRGTTGLTRTFVIDGKDLVFAIHVASYRAVRTKPTSVAVSRKRPGTAALGRYSLMLKDESESGADDAETCVRQIGYRLAPRGRTDPGLVGTIDLKPEGGERIIDMPVPQEGLGGALLSKVSISWKAENKTGCTTRMIETRQIGYGVVRQPDPHAAGW